MIVTGDTPNIVDSKLTKKLTYGLYDFAFSLIEIQRKWSSYIFNIDKKRIHWVDFWKEEKEKFEKLKRHIINKIDGHLRRTDFWNPKAKWTIPGKIEYIVGKYEIEPFFKVLDEEINKFENASKMPRKRGKPIHLKSKIVLLWSLVIESRRGVDWKTISELIDWFSFKLRDSVLGKKLIGKSEFTNPEYLLRQILSLKDKEHYKESLDELKNQCFPKEKKEPIFLINFKNKGVSLHDIKFLIEDIEYCLENKKAQGKINNKGFDINIIDYYQRYKNVPLIIFPNGETFP